MKRTMKCLLCGEVFVGTGCDNVMEQIWEHTKIQHPEDFARLAELNKQAFKLEDEINKLRETLWEHL